MDIKEELIKLKEKVTNKSFKEFGDVTNFKSSKMVILDDKVDDYIDWYTKNMGQDYCNKYHFQIEMRNFIEKMAVWYELRYPDYEINRLMPGSGKENIEIDDVMFNSNGYINEQLDEDSDVRVLDWDEFYNTKAFIHSLPWSERYVFSRAKYSEIVYWNRGYGSAHLHLTCNGFVEFSEYMDAVIPGISNEDLEDKNIKEIVNMLKEKGVKFPENNEFEKAIKDYDNWIY